MLHRAFADISAYQRNPGAFANLLVLTSGVCPVPRVYTHTRKSPGLVSSGVISEILRSPCGLKSSPKRSWSGSVCLPDFLHIHSTNGKASEQHPGEADNTAYSWSLHQKHPRPRQATQALGSPAAPHIQGDRRLGEGRP